MRPAVCPEVSRTKRERRKRKGPKACSIRDGGRPSAIGNQVQVANRHWVLWSKVMVLSAVGKVGSTHQVDAMKLNENESLIKRRKHIDAVETKGLSA